MEDLVLIKDVDNVNFTCKRIVLTDCFSSIFLFRNILKDLSKPDNLVSYLGYLNVLAEGIKMSMVAHRINDPDKYVIVGGVVVGEHNLNLVPIVSLRNAIVHCTIPINIKLSIEDLCALVYEQIDVYECAPEWIKPSLNIFLSVDPMKYLTDIYNLVYAYSKAVKACPVMDWCKENTPKSLAHESPTVLLNNMYRAYLQNVVRPLAHDYAPISCNGHELQKWNIGVDMN